MHSCIVSIVLSLTSPRRRRIPARGALAALRPRMDRPETTTPDEGGLVDPRAVRVEKRVRNLALFNLANDSKLLLHVLPDGFHRIRHYGLFANGARADKFAPARRLLDALPPASPPAEPDAPPAPKPCPCCGGRLTLIEAFERARTPQRRAASPLGCDTSGALHCFTGIVGVQKARVLRAMCSRVLRTRLDAEIRTRAHAGRSCLRHCAQQHVRAASFIRSSRHHRHQGVRSNPHRSPHCIPQVRHSDFYDTRPQRRGQVCAWAGVLET